jgi:hypothetical protein
LVNCKACCIQSYFRHPGEDLPWGTAGPLALTHYIKKNRLTAHAAEPDVFSRSIGRRRRKYLPLTLRCEVVSLPEPKQCIYGTRRSNTVKRKKSRLPRFLGKYAGVTRVGLQMSFKFALN